MARIRTIKPEFAESESVGKLSRDARLLFIMLWTFVDDSGKARASSRLLASRLFPYDPDAVDLMAGWLDELSQGGHVRLYEVDGDSYLDIPKWLKHQKIDRPTPSRLPDFREGSTKPREESSPHTLDHGPRTMDRKKQNPAASPSDSAKKAAAELFEEATVETNSKPANGGNGNARGTRLPEGWGLDDAARAYAIGLRLDPDQTADAFADYWRAHSGPTAVKRDWSAAFRTWCRNAAGRYSNGGGGKGATAVRARRGNDAFYEQLAIIADRDDD